MSIHLQQAMSKHPLTVRLKDDLQAAYIRMKREKFRHLPVIDDEGKLVGIISDRDFQRAMWPTEKSEPNIMKEDPTFRKDAKVAEYMSWPAITLAENTDLATAVNTMLKNKISAIVVTREDLMVGIITNEDLLKVLAALLTEPPKTQSATLAIAYNSPLGKIADFLATAGI
jgi:acetoin utilization protein AcuB